jgi:hypothetical protein
MVCSFLLGLHLGLSTNITLRWKGNGSVVLTACLGGSGGVGRAGQHGV